MNPFTTCEEWEIHFESHAKVMIFAGAAWGDWYSAAAAGNYYPTAQNGYNAYGAGKSGKNKRWNTIILED